MIAAAILHKRYGDSMTPEPATMRVVRRGLRAVIVLPSRLRERTDLRILRCRGRLAASAHAHPAGPYLTGVGALTLIYMAGLLRPQKQHARMGIDTIAVLVVHLISVRGLIVLPSS